MTQYSVYGGNMANLTGIVNSNTTDYRALGMGESRATETTTEANRKTSPMQAATFSNLWMYVSVNAHTSALVWTLRNNGANGNETISVTALTTGAFTDATHTDSYTSVTAINISQTVGASDAFHNLTVNMCSLLSNSSTTPVSLLTTVSDEGSQGASSTSYGQYCGGGSNSPGFFGRADDGTTRMELRRASAVIRNLMTIVSANTSTNAGTLTNRISGVDSSTTVSVTASTTGAFRDNTNTNTATSSDTINWKWVTGAGTSNAVLEFVQIQSQGGTSTDFEWFAGQGYNGAGSAVSTTLDTYINPFGCFKQSFETTEANTQVACPIAAKFSNMRIYLGSAGSGAQTMTFRIAGAGGNQSLSVTSATTGLFEEVTHNDTITAGQLVNFKLTHPTSGTCSPQRAAVLVNSTVTNTETGTGALAFSGIALTGTGTDSRVGTGALAFSGIALVSTGHDYEFGTGRLAFSGIAIVGAGADSRKGTGALAFSGIAIVGAGHDYEFGTGRLTFGGVAYTGVGSRKETATAALHFGALAITASGNVVQVIGSGGLAFSGLAILGFGVVPTAPGAGLRQFWTR